jgi:hypothetical protein
MKGFFNIILVAVLTMALISCKGHKSKPVSAFITVSPTTLTLEANTSATVNVSSNVAWTVSAPTGYTATPTTGSNNGTITIKAGASPSGGNLVVSGKGKSASVTIHAPTPSYVNVSPESVIIENAAGKTATISISTTNAWTITLPNPKPSWLTSVTPSSGTGNATVTITTGAYVGKTAAQSFLTVRSGSVSKYVTGTKEPKKNEPPTKPTNLKPQGTNVELITTFSWTASTDPDGDEITYTPMISKDNSTWNVVATTKSTKIMNKDVLEKNTTYYYKVVADDGFEGGKTESDVVTFTTGSTKSYWADGESRLYEVNADGSITEVETTTRPFKLIYTGDGYTQDLFKYGGQFDQEIDKGITALFEIEPYKFYYNYFAVYKLAAYSNEAGMSEGSTNWENATRKVDTKFRCSWEGGNSTGIGCNTTTVIEYAMKVPGMATMAAVTSSPISIIINADKYAGTNLWSYNSVWGGWNIVSIAQTPARHPSSSQGGFPNTLRHEYGGHGIGLLGDEYVYYHSTAFPQTNESTFRMWQSFGCYPNTYLPDWDATSSVWSSPDWNKTPKVSGESWNTFHTMSEYSGVGIDFFSGSAQYGIGIYRSEQRSCMIDNITHFNTISRWKIYCRIKITAGETPTLSEFVANDVEKVNPYSSSTVATKAGERRCEGPMLMDPWHKKPYRLK